MHVSQPHLMAQTPKKAEGGNAVSCICQASTYTPYYVDGDIRGWTSSSTQYANKWVSGTSLKT
jgi:hypothetical protein